MRANTLRNFQVIRSGIVFELQEETDGGIYDCRAFVAGLHFLR